MPKPTLTCPRCAYDLSGEALRWNGEDAAEKCCPCHGMCSECGLAFEWRYIMRPELAERPWFFETAQRKKIRRCLSTWARSLNPVSFWKRVKLETEPNVKRLIIYALIVVFMPILFHYGIHAASVFVNNALTTVPGGLHGSWIAPIQITARRVPPTSLDLVLAPFTEVYIWWPRFESRGIPWLLVMPALTIIFPIMLLAVSTTMRSHKVRFEHVLRASIYALGPLALTMAVASVILLVVSLDLAANIFVSKFWYPRNFQNANLFMRITEPIATWLGSKYPLYVTNWEVRTSSARHLYHWLLIPWYFMYWYCVLRFGWRIDAPSRGRIYLALAIPAMLATALALLSTPGFLLGY